MVAFVSWVSTWKNHIWLQLQMQINWDTALQLLLSTLLGKIAQALSYWMETLGKQQKSWHRPQKHIILHREFFWLPFSPNRNSWNLARNWANEEAVYKGYIKIRPSWDQPTKCSMWTSFVASEDWHHHEFH